MPITAYQLLSPVVAALVLAGGLGAQLIEARGEVVEPLAAATPRRWVAVGEWAGDPASERETYRIVVP